MATFLYAPGVRVYIATEKNGTVDVSEDLVDGSLQRRTDGVSTFNFSVQNARRKYDGVFTPNDRIIVEMKRITWVRVFTGYLNSVPLLTAWPRVVTLSASCSLKRLQYWYWDPNLSSAWTQINYWLGEGRGTSDAGIAHIARSLLKEVCNWPEGNTHIAEIPPNWFEIARPYIEALQKDLESADAYVQSYMNSIAASTFDPSTDSAGVLNVTASGTLKEGMTGGADNEFFSPDQLKNAEIIYLVGKKMGASDKVILAAIMTACQESRLIADAVSPSGHGHGLFQQEDGLDYGSVEDRNNPAKAAQMFYTKALRLGSKLDIWEPWQILCKIQTGTAGEPQQVITSPINPGQRWFVWTDYTQFQRMAESIVSQLNSANSVGSTGVSNPAATQQQPPVRPGMPTCDDLLRACAQVEQEHIPYGEHTMSDVLAVSPKKPSRLGCSGFVARAVFLATGDKGLVESFSAYSPTQGSYVKAHGSTITLEEASITKGAFLFSLPGSDGVGHVEISAGDGKHTYGATGYGTYGGVRDLYLAQFDYAGLPDFIDYSTAKNGVPPTVLSTGAGGTTGGTGVGAGPSPMVPYSETPYYNENNDIDKLFGESMVVLSGPGDNPESILAQSLAGPRALLNDQPFLPYLKNLLNASMRSFCSAPNGDLIAWFPDYYGLWGTASIMKIEPIELQDFYVEWSDDYFVTHQYTTAGIVNKFDVFGGNIHTMFGMEADPSGVLRDLRVMTIGIATIDIPAIMYSLFGIQITDTEGKNFADWIYKKFGARPNFEQVQGVVGKSGELFSALYYFQRQWAYQYNAQVPLTFMPELWPGMLIQIPEFNFQAYVTAVTHNFRFGQGGGFTTTVNVAAPARLPDGSGTKDNVLIGLPLASGALPGSTVVASPVDEIADTLGGMW